MSDENVTWQISIFPAKFTVTLFVISLKIPVIADERASFEAKEKISQITFSFIACRSSRENSGVTQMATLYLGTLG